MVCVELDKTRYDALINDEKRGDGSMIYALLARFQEKMAEKYGTTVGQEMIAATETAKELDAKVALIDIEATATFQELFRSMSFKERIKFTLAAVGGIFVSKKQVERELKRFESDSEGYIKVFEKQFPTLKHTLIDNRDRHMANKIRSLATVYPNMVVVIGDGHVNGIRKQLREFDLEIIHLSQLRDPKFKGMGRIIKAKREAGGTERAQLKEVRAHVSKGKSEVGFSFDYSEEPSGEDEKKEK